jgi:hypothetical protein
MPWKICLHGAQVEARPCAVRAVPQQLDEL